MAMHRLSFFIVFLLFLLFSRTAFAEGEIFINEFVAHPADIVLPDGRNKNGKEWVEFYNPDGLSLETYWIDDDENFTSDAGSSLKKSLKGNLQATDSAHPYINLSSPMFNIGADKVVLFDARGNIIDQYEYSDDPGIDTAIGRVPDGGEEFQLLVSSTKGEANSEESPTSSPSAVVSQCYDSAYVQSLLATLSVTKTPTPTHSTSSGSTTTPTKTPKPTKTPTPTKTPKPTRTPTPTKTPTPTPTYAVLSIVAPDASPKKKIATLKDNFSPVASSGSVLGDATKSADKEIFADSILADQKVFVKGASEQSLPSILILLGGVLIMGCGILIFLRKNK